MLLFLVIAIALNAKLRETKRSPAMLGAELISRLLYHFLQFFAFSFLNQQQNEEQGNRSSCSI